MDGSGFKGGCGIGAGWPSIRSLKVEPSQEISCWVGHVHQTKHSWMPQADLTRLATKLRHRASSSGLLDKDQKERKVSSKMFVCKRERDRRCVTDKVYRFGLEGTRD